MDKFAKFLLNWKVLLPLMILVRSHFGPRRSYVCTTPSKISSPARIGTFSRFSRGGIGHEKFSL